MDTTKTCPNCGKVLSVNAPKGLCPECLLQAGFPTGTEPEGKKFAFRPPSIEELKPHFDQLEILEFVGQGGMGAVYKARQPLLDRYVALKILPPESATGPGFTERFTREARALARLSHPNIVAVHEFGQSGGYHYLIMEFVDGANLREMERAGRLSAEQALSIVPKICEALQFAHDEGVVHRDIKPENILVDKKGRVKIADFGIAKILGAETQNRLTGAQHVVGTPHYMAPEQVEKPQSVDHRADIYSLGVVFYEMLTGELPLGRFAAPSKKVQIDVRLDEVVLRALEKEPEQRYQHASVLKTDIETLATSTSPSPSTPAIIDWKSAPPKTVQRGIIIGALIWVPVAFLIAQQHSPLAMPFVFAATAILVGVALNFVRCITATQALGDARKNEIGRWLGLIDSGNYRESWESTGASFKSALKEGEWVDRLVHVRRPLGDVFSRQLARVRLRSTSDAGAGSQAIVVLNTQFRELTAAKETITLSVNSRGEWKVIGYLIRPRFGIASPWLQRPAIRTALWVCAAAMFLNFALPHSWNFDYGVRIGVTQPWLIRLNQQRVMQVPVMGGGTREALQTRFTAFNYRSSSFCLGVAALVLAQVLLQTRRRESHSKLPQWILGGVVLLVVFLDVYVATSGPGGVAFGESAYVGQEWFPRGDLIRIVSVSRDADQMLVRGTYNLVSHDRATLALYITVTNAATREGSGSRLSVDKGVGSFELRYSPVVPGLPHVSMYGAEGKPFASVYFGTKPEAIEESKAMWITNEAVRAEATQQDLDGLPPVVVETFPVSGAANVDAGEAEIRVRFSKDMTDRSWSWSTAWENSAPESAGDPKYGADHRTCTMKVRLEPGRTYAYWLNSDNFQNFVDSNGMPAVPYLLIFETKAKEEKL